jgi:hypothetical protein
MRSLLLTGVFAIGITMGLTACGGSNEVVTVTQTVTGATATEPSEASPEESAGVFTKRHLEYEIAGQFGRAWDELHPVHQKLLTRSQYDSCSRREPPFAGNETIEVKETYDDPIDVPGIPQHESKAITVEVREPFEGGSATKQKATVHAVNVAGGWRWILSEDAADSYRRGECPDGSTMPESSTKRPPPPPAAASKTIRFSGNGTRQLPPVKVAKDSTLRWTHDGEFGFDLSDEDLDVNVSSEAAKGETYVPAGTYQFDVSADGNGTIVIR